MCNGGSNRPKNNQPLKFRFFELSNWIQIYQEATKCKFENRWNPKNASRRHNVMKKFRHGSVHPSFPFICPKLMHYVICSSCQCWLISSHLSWTSVTSRRARCAMTSRLPARRAPRCDVTTRGRIKRSTLAPDSITTADARKSAPADVSQ